MPLPASPTDGQVATIGTRSFMYVAATNQWLGAGSTNLAGVSLNELSGVLTPAKGGWGLDPSFDVGDQAGALSLINAASVSSVSSIDSRLDTVEAPRIYRVLDTAGVGDWYIRDDDHGKVIFITAAAADQLDINTQATTTYRAGIEVGIYVYGAGVITLGWPVGVFVDGVAGASSLTLVRHSQAMVSRNPANNLWNFGGLTAA